MNKRLQESKPDFDFVGVYPGGTLIYVLMRKRDEFDLIALPVKDHGENDNGHVLSKTLCDGSMHIVFQFWLKERTIETIRADQDKIRREREVLASVDPSWGDR
ncbi:hypothetical protein [Bradyrhizobium sp. CCBAU 51753]|uniref:hypothetical protein n=1 Tax=Bradyrhizobium sp. CCBAU 51753 TaxID=1325100 RepID=UPI00188BD2BD|nr:hypothetical protein [Bradyrhizobium sp. CCBAU 51753]QOZ25326.1 hypothetical protein XH93_18295 [Bradyrhizobium sp. CCBAU 51753]